jgi:hypothetical protein
MRGGAIRYCCYRNRGQGYTSAGGAREGNTVLTLHCHHTFTTTLSQP